MDVSIIIATYGSPEWEELAWSRAYPSCVDQGAREIIVDHDAEMYLDEIRNLAAEQATGEWLCFLDADDELAPGYVTEMQTAVGDSRGDALLVPAMQRVFDSRGTRDAPMIPNKGGWPAVSECVIGTMIPRRLFLQLGGFRELASLEDYDLFLRAWDAGAALVYVPDAVYLAYMREGSRNQNQSTYEQIWQDHLDRLR